MPFQQYTQCYTHTPGDKPFNSRDLASFAVGTSLPGLIAAFLAFAAGAPVIGFVIVGAQYAATIIAVANQWLFHRLVCVSGDQCAIGAIEPVPAAGRTTNTGTLLGAFDNDQFIDIRLMPHRAGDEYNAPNANFFAPPANPSDPVGTPPWVAKSPPSPGPTQDHETLATKQNDIFLDRLQGSRLVQPVLHDLPYTPVTLDEVPLPPDKSMPEGARVTRCTLHCEAEGSFWKSMKDYAALMGVAVAAGAAGGAAAGAAAGCAIGGFFGPIGCAIGALIGAIAGALAGGAAAGYVAANAAFNASPGNVNDANVGDAPLGQLNANDPVVVFGTHVYDGFHEGWHEFHPLKAIMRASDPRVPGTLPYLEWDPHWPDGVPGPGGLTPDDMRKGLDSTAFSSLAQAVADRWCGLVTEAFAPGTRGTQDQPQHRWTVHPQVDGCASDQIN